MVERKSNKRVSTSTQQQSKKAATLRRQNDRAATAQSQRWDEAIRQVLADADGALHYAEIADRAINGGLKDKKTVGANPAQTVANYLSTSLLRDSSSPYLRVGRGQYTLKDKAGSNTVADAGIASSEQATEAGALQAFGMFWLRDEVLWESRRLLGRQNPDSANVDFAKQVGVYILHDRDRVIYVGRASSELFTRLKAHTIDRLRGRWDRFSWFGLRSVDEDGNLSDHQAPWTPEVVIETMEALLIESLEPPLNRRRGDNFSALEFLQAEDPDQKKRRDMKIIEEMVKDLAVNKNKE